MNKAITKPSKTAFVIISIAALILFAALAFLFPNTGDDWAWGSSIGTERLNTWFENYNGRYAGNLLVMALTRSKLLAVIIMAVSYYSVCLISAMYSSSKKAFVLIFSVALFLIMPKAVFTQSVVWTAGFANYVPPIIIAALYILINKNILENKETELPKYMAFVTFAMGLIGSLFMENVSVFNVLLAIFIAAVSFINLKKISAVHIGFLIGSFVGCLIMFSNSAYSQILQGNDGYRDTATSFENFVEIGTSHVYIIFDNLIISNTLMCLIIAVIQLLIVFNYIKNSDNQRINGFLRFLVASNLTFAFLLCLQDSVKEILTLTPFNRYSAYYKLIMVVFACGYLATLALSVFIAVEKSQRMKLFFPLGCVPVIVAPLLVVNPIGPRCFFPAYVLLMMFAAALFGYMLKVCAISSAGYKHAFASVTSAAAGIGAFYLIVFAAIHSYDVKRVEFAKLQSENGVKTVVICELPNNSYLWTSEPKKEPWIERYKLFYGLNEDVVFEFVNREDFDRIVEEYNAGS